MTEFSADQSAAIDSISAFVQQRDSQYLTIHGLAGTGKSFVLAYVARQYPEAYVVAPTGRAASVLRKRTGLDVTTIHSAIYEFKGTFERQDDRDPEVIVNEPIFLPRGVDLSGGLILCDETSMVGQKTAGHLLDTGAAVVACGDPGQLPPVRDAPFFNEPDVTLTHIHRQALESPIIRQAHSVRTTGKYRDDGDAFRVVERANPDDVLAADVILCWRNVTRMKVNKRKRELLGYDGPVIQAGEFVTCLRNDNGLGVYNGETYVVTRDRQPEGDLFLQVGDHEVKVFPATVETIDPNYQTERETCVPFALGYCLTIHKSQGSEYPFVLLIDDFQDQQRDRRQLLYTGITRAVERMMVIRR